jgi:hypothetical protein
MSEHDMEVPGLGVSWPKQWPGAIGLIGAVLVVIAGVVLTCWLITSSAVALFKSNPKNTEDIILAIFSTKNLQKTADGSPRVQEAAGRLVQFWTPSSETQKFLKDESGNVQADEKWEVTDEKNVDKFEEDLWARFHGTSTDPGPLLGLRRYEALGRGQTRHKAGWWWVLNVSNTFDTKDLAEFYFHSWTNSKGLYVEELNGNGHYQQLSTTQHLDQAP